jgi:hypothetical protein
MTEVAEAVRTIELDFVLDHAHTFEGKPTTREAILAKIGEHVLTYTILTENGRAGGNPLLQLQGSEEQICSYTEREYCLHDLTEVDWYLSHMK